MIEEKKYTGGGAEVLQTEESKQQNITQQKWNQNKPKQRNHQLKRALQSLNISVRDTSTVGWTQQRNQEYNVTPKPQ